MINDERDDTNDSQALTGGDITRYSALVARISYLSQDRPDLKFAAMQVCCAMASPSVSDLERSRGSEGSSWGSHEQSACSSGNKASSKRTRTQA